MKVCFDSGPAGQGARFDAPHRIIRADQPEEVPAAFAAMEAAQTQGYWLAGFASYELGYTFSRKLMPILPEARRVPLMHFGVFDAPKALAAEAKASAGPGLSAVAPVWDFPTYAAAFAQAHDYIGAGDVYQVNLTFPIEARAAGAAWDLYEALRARQPVAHAAFVELEDLAILSRSPELFFEVDAQGVATTRPMKGTAPRSDDPGEDARAAHDLRHSPKNRAENLMIVDLLRNDLSRVAETGSVRVPRLFEVESYATVHQMVSDVEARLRGDVGLYEIFRAIFPCGSITGAPKIRAMQIISELEEGPRDVYCGAVGWVAPDGRMRFSVAIRTLLVWPDGTVRFNVGGGVVWDSTAQSEYEEALWKARFAELAPRT